MKHWPEPKDHERVYKNGYQYVLKVFVEGICTQSYKEMLQFIQEILKDVYTIRNHTGLESKALHMKTMKWAQVQMVLKSLSH